MKPHTDFQSHLARLLYSRASVRFEQGQLDEAHQDMAQAIRILERQLVSLVSGAFQQRQREDALDWYLLMVRICTRRGRVDEAIEYVERARTQNLVSLLAKQDLFTQPHVPTELAERFRRAAAEH